MCILCDAQPRGLVGLPRGLAFDRANKPFSKAAVMRARRAEESYARELRGVARQVGNLVRGTFQPGDLGWAVGITDALNRYAKVIEPWADAVGRRMLADVAARDRKMWLDAGRQIGRALHAEIEGAPTGALMQARLAEQVQLITSLPTEAGQRVHKLTVESLTNGTRAEQIAQEIMRSGDVAASRANMIARTEVGRTQAELVSARSQAIGSTHFNWRTVGDSDVRRDHRALDGKTFEWNAPPVADKRTGARALPGAIYNCRCYAEPVL
ncbi:phage head morphogenesis protein (plasmid) [Azospirillum baldaniorum]|uniref:Head morphogenesis protein n=1 Tax=Azospirillum baldaniorum TaxID=1064539 RepID=A0A9P1JZT7_9PROT|nr:phage minor head protein [Azospirillum baldaniorum]AWJ93309.1 phage head morphogenesis protein [Azospirillum baldaniorum]TWA78011.1 SPP1 gp7 family putative phage head morphogenesis protein [Azospirillum brasilense]CCD02887.1 putative head morphogenesis protein [Azospirillum baldaniorum]